MSLVRAIEELTEAIAGPSNRIRVVFHVGPIVEQVVAVEKTPEFQSSEKGEIMSSSQITATQNVRLSVTFTDRKGNPAPVHGTPQWLVDNSELVALEPEPDGMACLAKAVGPLGTAQVTLRADADLGDGETHIIGTHELQITGGTATMVEISAGAPEEQPEQ